MKELKEKLERALQEKRPHKNMVEIKLQNLKEIKIKLNNYLNIEHIKIFYTKNILGFLIF